MRIGFSLLILLSACAPATPPPHAGPRVTTLPPVELKTLDGRPARLDETLGGRVGVVALWATWCEACAQELDALERLHARAAGRDAVVVGIDVGEPASAVASVVAARGLTYPQLVDEEFRFADALGQKRVPTTLVVDRAGRVVFTGGALDAPALAAFRSALDAQLARR